MRSHRLALFLIALFLVAAPLLASAAGPGRGGGMPAMRASHERDADAFDNLSESAKGHGLDRAENARLFAKLTYANGTASGRFVRFGLNNTTGVVTDYTVLGGNNTTSTFFSSVMPTPFNATQDVRVTGSVLRLYGENATLKVHNNPLGLMQWSADGAPLTLNFTLAPGASVKNDTANDTLRINLNGSAVHGHVILAGPGNFTSWSNESITVSLEANSTLLFAAHPAEGGLLVSSLHALRDAAGNHTVGAVVNLVNADGSPLTDTTDLGVAAEATEIHNGSAKIHVSGDSPTGRSIVINVDHDSFPDANVTVMLDNQTLPNGTQQAAFAAQGGVANVTRTADGITIVVSVPHFSDHDIVIAAAGATTGTTQTTPTATTTTETTPSGTTTESPTTSSPTKGTPGFEAALLVAGAAAAAVLLLRRRS